MSSSSPDQQKKQIADFKQSLHHEIEQIFNPLDRLETITTLDFRKRSEQFYKSYYKNCKLTSDNIFDADNTIAEYHKRKYRQQKKFQDEDHLYDDKVMPLLESISMLSVPGAHDYMIFSNALADSIRFLFTCYSLIFSINMPRWATNITSVTIPGEQALVLKKILNSIGDDLVRCFREARIDDKLKVALTMLYGSEVQDAIIVKIADHLAAEEIAFSVATKIIGNNPNDKLAVDDLFRSLAETSKLVEGDSSHRDQIAFQRIFRLLTDLFTASLASHLEGSPRKPKLLTTETRMKLLDVKNDLIRSIEAEFERIK
jgi:hypothetical protein